MWSVLCFDQAGNSKIMILKLRSSWITVIFFEIAEAHQTYICKGCSHCIDPNLASIMVIGLLILPNKHLVLNTISISLQVSLFFTLQQHSRHIFAKVIHIALILTLYPSWRSICSSFARNFSCSTTFPFPSHFRYSNMPCAEKYHSHTTECYFYV